MNGRAELTLGSLFDGIGGWLLAAQRAGIRAVWASEIDRSRKRSRRIVSRQ